MRCVCVACAGAGAGAGVGASAGASAGAGAGASAGAGAGPASAFVMEQRPDGTVATLSKEAVLEIDELKALISEHKNVHLKLLATNLRLETKVELMEKDIKKIISEKLALNSKIIQGQQGQKEQIDKQRQSF